MVEIKYVHKRNQLFINILWHDMLMHIYDIVTFLHKILYNILFSFVYYFHKSRHTSSSSILTTTLVLCMKWIYYILDAFFCTNSKLYSNNIMFPWNCRKCYYTTATYKSYLYILCVVKISLIISPLLFIYTIRIELCIYLN